MLRRREARGAFPDADYQMLADQLQSTRVEKYAEEVQTKSFPFATAAQLNAARFGARRKRFLAKKVLCRSSVPAPGVAAMLHPGVGRDSCAGEATAAPACIPFLLSYNGSQKTTFEKNYEKYNMRVTAK